jgi:CubicO group peptidase (beta-lactamase class C family)
MLKGSASDRRLKTPWRSITRLTPLRSIGASFWRMTIPALALFIACPAEAQQADGRTAEAPALTAPDFAARAQEIDTALQSAFKDDRFSSAAVSLVTEGGDTFTRAYGMADADAGVTASASDTTFLIASLTKTFTALSVLQLYDRGKIASLDDPANTYLKRTQLPDWKGEEVTIRHLLSHRSGLETMGFGIIRHYQMTAPASAAFVRAHTPKLVRRPGEAIIYSNEGIALLGMMVEDITGMTLQRYLEAEILTPLGMNRSILNYSITEPAGAARAYSIGDGEFVKAPFEANTPFMAPAGSMMVTADDMARYLSFWMDRGRTWSSQILSAATFQEAITEQARNFPEGSGVGLGIFLTDWNGAPLFDHTGAFAGYSAYMAISPDTGLAAFIAVAGRPADKETPAYIGYSDGAALLSRAITGRSARTYSPKPLTDARAYEGLYINDRRFTRGVPGMMQLRTPMRVEATDDGFLTINGAGPFGLVGESLVAVAGDGVKAPTRYSLPTPDNGYFRMNVDRARRAGPLQTPVSLERLLIAGVILLGLSSLGAFRIRGALNLTDRITMWSPHLGLAAVGGALSAIFLFWPSGQSIFNDLIAGESLRVSVITACAWLSIAAAALVGVHLACALQTRKTLWSILALAGLAGSACIALFMVATGLTDLTQI